MCFVTTQSGLNEVCFFYICERVSVLRPIEKKCPHQSNSHCDDTYKFGHRFDNIVDPTDKIWGSWYHRHCFDNHYYPCFEEKISLQSLAILAIQKHTNYACKTYNTKIQYQPNLGASCKLHEWNLRKILIHKHTPWGISITNDGLLHSRFQSMLVVLQHFVWQDWSVRALILAIAFIVSTRKTDLIKSSVLF